MTASAWLHMYHQMFVLIEKQTEKIPFGWYIYWIFTACMLSSGDMMQVRLGISKICDDDPSAFTCDNMDVFLQTSAPCRSPKCIYSQQARKST
jgi:hypothetical protein